MPAKPTAVAAGQQWCLGGVDEGVIAGAHLPRDIVQTLLVPAGGAIATEDTATRVQPYGIGKVAGNICCFRFIEGDCGTSISQQEPSRYATVVLGTKRP